MTDTVTDSTSTLFIFQKAMNLLINGESVTWAGAKFDYVQRSVYEKDTELPIFQSVKNGVVTTWQPSIEDKNAANWVIYSV